MYGQKIPDTPNRVLLRHYDFPKIGEDGNIVKEKYQAKDGKEKERSVTVTMFYHPEGKKEGEEKWLSADEHSKRLRVLSGAAAETEEEPGEEESPAVEVKKEPVTFKEKVAAGQDPEQLIREILDAAAQDLPPEARAEAEHNIRRYLQERHGFAVEVPPAPAVSDESISSTEEIVAAAPEPAPTVVEQTETPPEEWQKYLEVLPKSEHNTADPRLGAEETAPPAVDVPSAPRAKLPAVEMDITPPQSRVEAQPRAELPVPELVSEMKRVRQFSLDSARAYIAEITNNENLWKFGKALFAEARYRLGEPSTPTEFSETFKYFDDASINSLVIAMAEAIEARAPQPTNEAAQPVEPPSKTVERKIFNKSMLLAAGALGALAGVASQHLPTMPSGPMNPPPRGWVGGKPGVGESKPTEQVKPAAPNVAAPIVPPQTRQPAQQTAPAVPRVSPKIFGPQVLVRKEDRLRGLWGIIEDRIEARAKTEGLDRYQLDEAVTRLIRPIQYGAKRIGIYSGNIHDIRAGEVLNLSDLDDRVDEAIAVAKSVKKGTAQYSALVSQRQIRMDEYRKYQRTLR